MEAIRYFPVFCKSILLTAKKPTKGKVIHCICNICTLMEITSLSAVIVLTSSFEKTYKSIAEKIKNMLPIMAVSLKASCTLVYFFAP